MTDVIVVDASCLIDLRKGRLLTALCSLPYQLVVPLPVRKSEVLDDQGMLTYDLTPDEVPQALTLKQHHRALSASDCFCLVTALAHRGILLTGDAPLRRAATEKELSVHGVLWIISELVVAKSCPISLLIEALQAWQSDETVFLPPDEVS